jgi:hypothetical protein
MLFPPLTSVNVNESDTTKRRPFTSVSTKNWLNQLPWDPRVIDPHTVNAHPFSKARTLKSKTVTADPRRISGMRNRLPSAKETPDRDFSSALHIVAVS